MDFTLTQCSSPISLVSQEHCHCPHRIFSSGVGNRSDFALPSQTANSSLLVRGLGSWRKVSWSLINLFYPLLFNSVCQVRLGWTCESLQIPAVISQSSYNNATVEYFLMLSLWSGYSRITTILVILLLHYFPQRKITVTVLGDVPSWNCGSTEVRLEVSA